MTTARPVKEQGANQVQTTHILNKRIYCDDLDTKGMSWIELLVAVPTLFLYTGWMHVLLCLMFASVFYVWPRVVLALLFGTLLLPARPILWQPFNRSWVFKTWRKYFKFSFLFEANVDAHGHYVYVEFPHGVFPMGPLIAGTLCQVLFPDHSIYSLAASSVFSIPFWRHFIAWMGSMPATSKNFRYLLKQGSVAVIVGGIAEMFMQSATKEQIKLKDRKGFVRVAIEEGADGIIPVYQFGNTQLLDIFPKAAEKLSRTLKSALCVFYGTAGLPLPRRKELFMVMGKPIPVRKTARDDPNYEAEVDRVHALVLQAVQDLYDRHKEEFGWKDRPLVIL